MPPKICFRSILSFPSPQLVPPLALRNLEKCPRYFKCSDELTAFHHADAKQCMHFDSDRHTSRFSPSFVLFVPKVMNCSRQGQLSKSAG